LVHVVARPPASGFHRWKSGHPAQGQRELHVEAPRGVGGDEVLQCRRDLGVGIGRAPGQRIGCIGSRIPRPPLDGIEGNNSNRKGVLAGQEILQDRLKLSASSVSRQAQPARTPKSSSTR
jgi:hypothetical protein